MPVKPLTKEEQGQVVESGSVVPLTPEEEGQVTESFGGPGQAFLGRVNRQFSNIAGAAAIPVDLINAGLNRARISAGLPESEFLGLTDEGIRSAEPTFRAPFEQALTIDDRGIGFRGRDIAIDREEFERLPRIEQIAGRAGDITGASIPFAGIPGAVARTGRSGGILLRPLVESFRRGPAQFVGREAAGIAGAAQGAAIAETLDPGNAPVRFFAEVAGGFLNPAGLSLRVLGGAKNQAFKTIQSMSKAGREDRAAEIVQDIIRETGENPDDIVRMLNRVDEIELTSGLKSGSPALIALEEKLAKGSAKFSGQRENTLRTALRDLDELISKLASTGRPEDLRVAAQLRERHFDDLLRSRVNLAEIQAAEARAAAFGKEGRAAAQDASDEAFRALDDALQDVVKVEKQLWGRVPDNISVGTTNLSSARQEVASRLLPEESLPAPVQKAMDRISRGDTTIGEMRTLRSRAMDARRKAAKEGDFGLASALDEVANAALDDLFAAAPTSSSARQAFEAARQFSRQKNEVFTQTFAGDALARDATGARRISPEIMLERAFAGGGNVADVRFRQLRQASAFPDNSGFAPRMLDAQERFLAIAAQRTAGADGNVNPDALQRFVRENEAVLDAFPLLRSRLQTAESAQRAFRDVEQASQSASKIIQQKAAFGKLVGREDPVQAVDEVLRSGNPSRGLVQLARLAKKSGSGARAGLQSSALESAIRRATDSSGRLSFARLNEIMRQPVGGSNKSLIELLTQNGVMDKRVANRFLTLTRRARSIEEAFNNPTKLDQLLDEPDAMFDLMLRLVGANVGASGAVSRASGAALVTAGATSRALRNIFERVPGTRVTSVLIEAANNPKFMSALIQKPKTVKKQRELGRQIESFLIGAGLTSAQDPASE